MICCCRSNTTNCTKHLKIYRNRELNLVTAARYREHLPELKRDEEKKFNMKHIVPVAVNAVGVVVANRACACQNQRHSSHRMCVLRILQYQLKMCDLWNEI